MAHIAAVSVSSKRTFEGVVVSNKMNKTITVEVARTYKHPLTGKIVRSTKKYKAHDEANNSHIGDVVEIAECRPLSKTKHMMFVRVVRAAAAVKG